jgi:hypothetical protein
MMEKFVPVKPLLINALFDDPAVPSASRRMLRRRPEKY